MNRFYVFECFADGSHLFSAVGISADRAEPVPGFDRDAQRLQRTARNAGRRLTYLYLYCGLSRRNAERIHTAWRDADSSAYVLRPSVGLAASPAVDGSDSRDR